MRERELPQKLEQAQCQRCTRPPAVTIFRPRSEGSSGVIHRNATQAAEQPQYSNLLALHGTGYPALARANRNSHCIQTGNLLMTEGAVVSSHQVRNQIALEARQYNLVIKRALNSRTGPSLVSINPP